MDWVRESKAQGRLLKGTDYLLKDKEQEEKLNICIERVVNMEVPFLQKWVICCLPGVKPEPSEVAKLTRCCGGVFVENMRHLKFDKNVILVTKKDDLTHAEKEMIREAKRRKFYRIECRRFFALVGRQSRKAFEAALSH
uniref:BRCT domain-containing protein n=1 Tax=Steinernema glaseri TaxID=37863 RepID=A0A1I7YK85_9BILA